jgi:DNA-binding transcriptional regulator YhcF (GntR family)
MIYNYKDVLLADKDYLVLEIKRNRNNPEQKAKAMKELQELIKDAQKCGIPLSDLCRPICLN